MSTADDAVPDNKAQPAPPNPNGALGCLIAVVVICVVGFALLGGSYVIELPVALVLGWGFYLFRVLPELEVSGAGVATFLVTLLLLAAGVHVAAQWWLQRSRPDDESPAWTPSQTARLVCLVCLAFAAAIGITGVVHQTGWLLNSPEPIVKSSFTAHLRTESKNHLHEMGEAFHTDAEHTIRFTNGIIAADGRVLHSWQTALLRYMDDSTVDESVDFDRSWYDPRNRVAMQSIVPQFLNSGIKHREQTAEGFGASHYAANLRVICIDRGFRPDEITDGQSNTILAGEVATNFRAWGDPLNIRDPTLGINQHLEGFGGPFTGGMHFLLADGAVQFVNEKIDPDVLRALSTPDAGDKVEPF